MNKILKTTLLSAFCLVLLASCGKKDNETSPNSANVGSLMVQDGMGPESPDCPKNYDPICVEKSVLTDQEATYQNACHAEKVGETAWQPGEC